MLHLPQPLLHLGVNCHFQSLSLSSCECVSASGVPDTEQSCNHQLQTILQSACLHMLSPATSTLPDRSHCWVSILRIQPVDFVPCSEFLNSDLLCFRLFACSALRPLSLWTCSPVCSVNPAQDSASWTAPTSWTLPLHWLSLSGPSQPCPRSNLVKMS